ncbi:tubulin/FtsZ family, GTPase domain protein [Bacillus sp. NRRL B-14911]|uniref:cell division protein FtsZ n=1 Tax=Bacillus sp. NRRL B-14911 TaxID=313627 RepID=UPI00006B5993|nr:cell division protein FtsZ [Bacillus sp. NRRL B-14911]EAR66166.1 tubulin/FtsZ family, GTPase domain protein [Bacillus sp. NRRL B-14911]
MNISLNNNGNLGALKALLSPHVFSNEVSKELSRFPSQTIIGLGQGGGRIAAELARFGFPTYLLNSSKSDMEEHRHLISEERRILTKSEEFPELEGTDKNAQLGYQIAIENKEIYKKVALSEDVQKAEFVWVTVSLGGGTGNGALKVALTYLSQVRAHHALPGGKIPLGVICSLPSSEERGSSFRQNALAGIALIQQFMNENKMGNALVIDNEKMKDYYANNPLKTYGGHEIDAKSYSNMVVASILAEVSTLPLLEGRSVFDKTELLTTLSTPGWLSISKNTEVGSDDNLENKIHTLYKNNEVLADYEVNNALAGAIAVMYPSSKNISPRIADDVYKYSSELLESKVNLSISTNSKVSSLTLYGLSVLPAPSTRVHQLREEKDQWIKIEKEQEEAKKRAAATLNLNEFDDFFSAGNKVSRNKGALSTLDDDFGPNNQEEKKLVTELDDLDLDF